MELDWTPKGQKETVEKFLHSLPVDAIPIKGSQAASDRKLQLQKQIPIHDIDPSLCHELTENELEEMNKYIAHVKEKSVGVGQLVSLGNLIRGVAHNLNPVEMKVLHERYGKNIPIFELVKLQSQANVKPLQITKDMERLNVRGLNSKEALGDLGDRNHLQQNYGNQQVVYGSLVRDKNYLEGKQEVGNLAGRRKYTDLPKQIGQQPSYGDLRAQGNLEGQVNIAQSEDVLNNLQNPVYGGLRGNQQGQSYSNLEDRQNHQSPIYGNLEGNKYDPNLGQLEEIQNNPLPPPYDGLRGNQQGNIYGNYGQGQILGGHKNNNPQVHKYGTVPEATEAANQLKLQKQLPNYTPGNLATYSENQTGQSFNNFKDLAYSTYNNPPGERVYSPNHNQQLPINNQQQEILQPENVNIGSIKDIYPDIKTANFGQNENFIEDLPLPSEATYSLVDNIVIPDCHGCKQPFDFNEFAITIEKSSSLYHAGCFKCAGCNQILADNMYFYHKETNNVYCLRDYAKVKGYPRCKGCDELIFTKEYCLTEENTFHLKHFCCLDCDSPLAGQNYLLENSQPICLPCYEKGKAEKCLGCNQIIKPFEEGLTLKDKHFHVRDECFCCRVCSKPLLGKKLMFKNNRLYCSPACYQKDED